MNVDKIIKNTIEETTQDKNAGGGDIYELLTADILTDEIKDTIYFKFKEDIKVFIEEYLLKCQDPNACKGMYKCSLETWQACISDIGRLYFKKHGYLKDIKKIQRSGGVAYRDELLCIALDVYADLCAEFRKQFFIYDCAQFMGLSMDCMYSLNTLHADMLKKAHTKQEASMRTALASGRSNVTAMAILLNHDYDYTRTTQVIHTTDKIKSADTLPTLLIDEKTTSDAYQNGENM